jgi:hypothetical protein
MSIETYRNESLVRMETYQTDPAHADALVGHVRAKWALLRDKGFAGDYPVEVLRSGRTEDGQVKVVELFRWKSRQAEIDGKNSPEYHQMVKNINSLMGGSPSQESFTQVVRGFNSNFPSVGGVELLKGVCSCLLTVNGMVENYQMSVKNGIVLMHRSPRMDLDGDGLNEMYLKILMHGGEIIQAALGPIRVEQNFSRPNDGIVKSLGGVNDFPARAIWRVSWRIQTALGPVVTDPDTPLIFGPAIVAHYPPVGTHFHSPTGKVKLLLEESGVEIGHLIPGELTAFDIVVTKDDEIFADILNSPPKEVFNTLEQYTHLLDKGAALAAAAEREPVTVS